MTNKLSKKLLGGASLLAIAIGLTGCSSSNNNSTSGVSASTTVSASNKTASYNQGSTSTTPRTRQS